TVLAISHPALPSFVAEAPPRAYDQHSTRGRSGALSWIAEPVSSSRGPRVDFGTASMDTLIKQPSEPVRPGTPASRRRGGRHALKRTRPPRSDRGGRHRRPWGAPADPSRPSRVSRGRWRRSLRALGNSLVAFGLLAALFTGYELW